MSLLEKLPKIVEQGRKTAEQILEGWQVVVGRDRYIKPIHYYDKNLELILVSKPKQ
jgi:hypothetical protein